MITVGGVAEPIERPGFRAGFAAVFSGFGFLARSPRAWPYAVVPALVFVVLSVLFAYLAIWGVNASVAGWLGESSGWFAKASATLLTWLGSVLGAILGLLLALAATPPLSGPALERIVGYYEAELGVPTRTPIGLLAEMWCALRAQAFAAMFAIPLLALLWIVELLFAPAVFVTVPLKFLVSALSLAWNLFDYPLTLRGVRMRDRFQMVLDNKAAAFGFGLAFAVLFWIPCFGVLLLPVGVAAATRIVWRIAAARPGRVPRLDAGLSALPPAPPLS